MDVHNDRKRRVGPGRPIRQYPDRVRAKRTLDMDLAGRDIWQVWYRNGTQQRKPIGAALH